MVPMNAELSAPPFLPPPPPHTPKIHFNIQNLKLKTRKKIKEELKMRKMEKRGEKCDH